MKNKITFKDIVYYSYIILSGKLTPFLKSEILTSEIDNLFMNLKEKLDTTDYCRELLNFLEKYYGYKKDIYLTNSGRDALYLILLNLKLKKKEIIIPSYSCLGLIEPILQLNYHPHFIDIDRSLNPSLKSIEKAINSKTAAVVIPHLGGTYAADTQEIISICKKKRVIVIEDCCQAFGLNIKKKKIGTFADLSFYSSGIGKPIFTPSGGWIVSKKGFFKNFKIPNQKNVQIDDVFKDYKNFSNRYSDQPFKVFKQRLIDKFDSIFDNTINKLPNLKNKSISKNLNNFSAYFILKQIMKLDEHILKRTKNAINWIEKLKENENIEIINNFNSIYNKLYVSSGKVEKKKILFSGIEVENGYVPLHLRYDFNKYNSQDLINTNALWKNIYSLPVRPSLNFNLLNLT